MEERFEELGYKITRAVNIPGFFTVVDTGREGRQLPYASEQVVEVYKVLSDEKVSKHEEIAACIKKTA